MYEISKPVRCKNREKYTLKKNTHIQDSIYVVQQFVYVHKVARILLFSRKKYRVWQYDFLSLSKTNQP